MFLVANVDPPPRLKQLPPSVRIAASLSPVTDRLRARNCGKQMWAPPRTTLTLKRAGIDLLSTANDLFVL